MNLIQMRMCLVLIFILLTAGCSNPTGRVPLPTLEIVRIGFTPAAMIWQKNMQACLQQIPGTALAAYEYPDYESIPEEQKINFFVQLGDDLPASTFTTLLGLEKLVWVTGAESPSQQLTLTQLKDFYQGKAPGTASLSQAADQAWVYPKENVLTRFLIERIDVSPAFLSTANIAPDPAAMLAGIIDTPSSLGYIPESWLDETASKSIKILPILDLEGGEFKPEIQVFAISNTQPDPTSREALLCFKERLLQSR